MSEIVIKNVKEVSFTDVNINKEYDPHEEHKHQYIFKNYRVTDPYVTGEGKLSVRFYILEPGNENYPYHYHSSVEEVFYIISGHGTLQTPKGKIDVKEGDVIVMPPNENGAHKLINTSQNQLLYLDIDSVNSPDVAFYPENEKIRVLINNEFQKSFRLNTEINYLEGE